MSKMTLPKGLAARYRVEELLGRGGFSKVYRATQLDLDRQVALKIMLPLGHDDYESADDSSGKCEDLTKRFTREARMISKLRCQHTVTMYEYGSEDGRVFMCMEYVDGQNLAEVLKEQGAIEPDRVAHIAKQLLMSLTEAHSMGIMHRDIKPQNVMLFDHMGVEDQVRLLDFGIVKLTNDDEYDQEVADLTSQDTLLGTPRYMAPEYIRGEDYLPSSDLYGVGLVLYGLAMGEHAIQTNSSFQILSKQLDPESFRIEDGHDDVDLSLRLIINKLIRKDLSERYETAQQVLDDLEKREHAKLVATMSTSQAIIIERAPETNDYKSYFMAAMLFAAALTGVLLYGVMSRETPESAPTDAIHSDTVREARLPHDAESFETSGNATQDTLADSNHATANNQPFLEMDSPTIPDDNPPAPAAPDIKTTTSTITAEDEVKAVKKTTTRRRKKTQKRDPARVRAPAQDTQSVAEPPPSDPSPVKKAAPVEAPKTKRIVKPLGTSLAPMTTKKEPGLIKIK